jgi:sulfur carrier protein ThiS
MPLVTLKLYAELRRYSEGKPSLDMRVHPGATIAELMQQLGVSMEQTRLIFVNGRAAHADDVLNDGDKVEVFSAVGGG